MSEENPFAPPSATDSSSRRRRPLGAIWVSLIASAVAIYLLGDRGLVSIVLVGSIAGVGSWWAYKFWPRSKASDDPKATDYLQDLERPSPGTAGPLNTGAGDSLPDEPSVRGLENPRLLGRHILIDGLASAPTSEEKE